MTPLASIVSELNMSDAIIAATAVAAASGDATSSARVITKVGSGSEAYLNFDGTTGSSAVDGWNEFARWDLGSLSSVFGTTFDPTVHGVQLRCQVVAPGTRNSTSPLFMLQMGPASTPPATTASSPGAGFVASAADSVALSLGSSSNVFFAGTGAITPPVEMYQTLWPSGTPEAFPRGMQFARFPATHQLVDSNLNIAETATLWFGIGQTTNTSAAYTGMQARWTARLLEFDTRISALPTTSLDWFLGTT